MRAVKSAHAWMGGELHAHLLPHVGATQRLLQVSIALEPLQEKAAFQRHIKGLAQKLVALRAQLPEAAAAAAQAAEEDAAEEAEAAAAGGELQSDAFAAAQRGQVGSEDSGGSSGSGGQGGEQPFLAEAAWQRMQAAGRRQGWLADPEEVVLGDVIGRGTFGAFLLGLLTSHAVQGWCCTSNAGDNMSCASLSTLPAFLAPTGVVHQATWQGGCVAVKRVQPRSREQATTFVREVEALALLRHPHVMQLYAACVRPPGDFWLICELLRWEGGEGGALLLAAAGLACTVCSATACSQQLTMLLDGRTPCPCIPPLPPAPSCLQRRHPGRVAVRRSYSAAHAGPQPERAPEDGAGCGARHAGPGGARAPDSAPRPQALQRGVQLGQGVWGAVVGGVAALG